MPFAEFQPSDAGARINQQILGNVDFGMSLMERATRNQALLQDIEQRKVKFAQDVALNDADLQMKRAKLAEWQGEANVRQAQNRAAVAVADGTYTAATTEAETLKQNSIDLKNAAADLPSYIERINSASTPQEVQSLAADFHGKYGHLAGDKLLGNRYAALEGQVAGRLAARSSEYQSKILAASSSLMPAIDPQDPTALARVKNSPFYTMARLDPAFAKAFDDASKQATEHAFKTAEENQKSQAAKDLKQTPDGAKEADNKRELSVPGFSGMAPTKEEAVKFRDAVTTNLGIIQDVQKIADLSAKPGASIDLPTRATIREMQDLLVGKLRIPLTGPGAFTDAEREFVRSTLGNPSKIFSLSSVERAKLNTMVTHLMSDIDRQAAGLGLQRSGVGANSVQRIPATPANLQAAAAELARRPQ